MNIALKRAQWEVFGCDRRFRVLVAGRRFGKTYLALVELCRAAWGPGRKVWYVAPTYREAKRIAWTSLKQMTRSYWATRPNETDLRIELVSGGSIALRGADRYDSLRGEGLDFLVLDEYASMERAAWTEVLRPSLSDRQGKALFIGTPRGHNHFHELFETAQQQPDWGTFRFTTEQGGNVTAGELKSAARSLDPRTYEQEYQASFENRSAGRVYYAFDRAEHVRAVEYDPRQPLFWSLPESNTWAACEEFLARTEGWWRARGVLTVHVYGDASGESRKTSASRTDWRIVREFLERYPDRYRGVFRVPSANPGVKDRINCVNARLRNQAAENRLGIHPRCRELIQDFEQVCWKGDGNGNALAELDKSDAKRTHVSDATGYMLAREFAMRAPIGDRSTFIAC